MKNNTKENVKNDSASTFNIYNRRSVDALIKENPDILKYVNKDGDYSYNKDKINNVITQSIMRGFSLDKITERITQVTGMDENGAKRTARTAMTAAENLGRNEGYHDLKEKGIPCRFQWSATHDNRTRDLHILLDGQYQDEDGKFRVEGYEIEFPGDPTAEPEMIYNCRCRASLVLNGVDHSQDGDLYEKFMKENYPDDWDSIEKGIKEKESAYREKASGARERVQAEVERRRNLEDVKEEVLKDEIPEMPQSVRDAYDKFEDKYIDSTKEHGMLFDKDGNLLSQSQSKRNESVSIASESMYEDHGQGAYEIHNHTADELFSWKDISNYEKYGMNGTITIPSGWEFTLYNSNDPRWNWDDAKRMEVDWLASAWSDAQETISDEWTQERRAFIDSVQGYDRQEQRRLVREWEDEHSRLDMQIQWLEDHSEEYGFMFEKRRLK